MADEDTTWMLSARCRDKDPAIFFPVDGQGFLTAREVCAGCGVQSLCLDYAFRWRIEHGVWGGTSERERRRIVSTRRREGLSVVNYVAGAPREKRR